MALRIIQAPTEYPVLIEEARTHLRSPDALDNADIQAYIAAATGYAESFCKRSLAQTTYRLTLDSFPSTIELPKPPAVSVASIKYLDTSGVEQTLASTEYVVDTDSEPARIVPALYKSWPPIASMIGAVRVEFVAGYAAEDVPEVVRHAIKMLVSHFYENRENEGAGGTASPWSISADALLFQHRILDL